MLIAPLTRVSGIDTDDRNTAARCHRGQTITELGGGNTSHDAPKLLTPTTTTQHFATRGTGIGKVEVLHRDRHTMIALRYVQQLRDRRAQVPITVGGTQLLDLEGDRDRFTDRVARRIQHTRGEMIGVEVDTENPPAAELLKSEGRFRGDRPGRIQIPAAALRIENDVVAHRLALLDPRSPLRPTVSEPDPSGELKVPAELTDQRGGNFELQPTLHIDTNGLVTASLSSLAVSGQEHARSVPPIPPLLLVHLRRGQVGAVAPQPFSTHRDRRATRGEFLLCDDESLLQDRQPAGLGEPLRRRGVSAFTFTATGVSGIVSEFTRAQGATLLKDIDRRMEIGDASRQAAHSQLVLVFHRACDRARPP
ncbi:MAG: hypothetical protein O3A42_12230 [Actinobacteria bacterium]|nr:hypothetical protein [Actinomycetota bacterium]